MQNDDMMCKLYIFNRPTNCRPEDEVNHSIKQCGMLGPKVQDPLHVYDICRLHELLQGFCQNSVSQCMTCFIILTCPRWTYCQCPIRQIDNHWPDHNILLQTVQACAVRQGWNLCHWPMQLINYGWSVDIISMQAIFGAT